MTATPTDLPLHERPAGVMFHHFHGAGYPVSQGSISGEDLERIIVTIGPERILPAHEWGERTRAGALKAGDLCLTFDDNLLCQYRIALPVLKKYGLTAFFFAYTSVHQGVPERLEIFRHFRTVAYSNVDEFYKAFLSHLAEGAMADEVARAVRGFDADDYLPDYPYLSPSDKVFRYLRDRVLGRERYERSMDEMLEKTGFDYQKLLNLLWMNDEILIELDRGDHVVGLHSHTHPTLLGELPIEDQRAEYVANAMYLKRLFGRMPWAMSHPNNSYSRETLSVLSELGVEVGFRANMACPNNGALELPRHNHALLHRAIVAGQWS